MKVMRDGDAQPVNPSGMIDLLDGDIVAILTGIHITCVVQIFFNFNVRVYL